MVPVEVSQLLRLAVLSGVVGFAGFCLSYALYVWRRRNAAQRAARSRVMKLGQVLVLLGAAAIAICWAFNEFQGRTGIAGGSDLFVVRATREISAEQITGAETVAQGEVVAEFLSPADRTRLAGIDLQKAQAQAKKDAIENKVLQADEALLGQQTHIQSALLQLKGFAFQLRNSSNEIERGRATLLTAWTREESKLLEDEAAAARDLATAESHRAITARAMQRGLELQKQGNIAQRDLDIRSSEDLTAGAQVIRDRQTIASLRERRRALEERFQASIASFDRQISDVSSDYARVQQSLAELEPKAEEIEQQLRADRARANASRQREVEAVDYDITILAAERTRLIEAGQVRAPFSGRVVYRNPAPGLASAGSPILAISAGTGFTAKIRLPRSEIPELSAEREPIQVALDAPVLQQFFTGKFVRAEPVPFEPDRVIAYFECSLPPEIIGFLGSTVDPVRVRVLWRPSLLRQPGFRCGAILLGAGLLALAFGARQRAASWRPARARQAEPPRQPPAPITVSRVDGRPSAKPGAAEFPPHLGDVLNAGESRVGSGPA